jgi:outer membrane protein assembly factor BamB
MVFFAPTDTPFLFACNTLTGETIFKAPRPEAGMACVAGGLLLAGDDLRVLDTNQGLLRQRLILPRPAVGPPLPLAKGVFLPLEGQALILTGTPLTMAARVLVPQRRWDAVGLGGTVLSRSGQGMRVWENRLKVHDRASSMAQSPDPRDRLKAAGLWAEIGDAEKALVLLRELTTAGKEIAASAQELRVALLAQKLRRAAGVLNEAEADEAATELSEFSKDPAVGLGAARKALRDRDWERAVPLLLHVLQSSPDAIVSFPGPRPAREAVRELAFSFGLGGPDPAAYRCAVAAAVHLPSGGEGPLAVENLLHAYILLPSTEWDSAKTLAASWRRGGSEVRARNLLKEFALHSSVPSLAAAGLLSRLGASSGHRGSARLWAGRVAEIVLGNFSGAGGWAPFQADPTLLHTGQAPYRLVWRLEDMPEEGLLRPVIPRGGGALAGRWVFIGTPNTLWCLDSHTGVARWIRRTGTRRGPVLCHGSRLVVVSAEGLENLDAGTGNTVWRFPFPRPLGQGEADLVLWGGRLAAAVPVAEGTALYGLDARTGRPEWTVLLTCGRPYLWVPLEDAKVLLYAGDGRRYHVDLCDGTCREDASLGKALSVKKGKAEVFHTGLFRVAGAFRSGHEAVLWGADAGRILWRKSVPRLEAVIAGSGLLFAALRAKWGDVDIVCLDAMSGLPRWTRRLAWEQVAGMQLHPSGKLLVHGREKAGRLAVLSGTSGDVLWTAPLKSDGFSVSGEAVAFSDGWSKVSFRDLSTGRSLGSTEVGPGRLKGVHFLAGPILLAVTTGGVGILGPVQAVPVPFDAVRDPDAAVHLFGAGRPREALRTWTRALACDDRVVFGPWDAALLNARGLWEEASWRKKRVLGVYRMERPPTIDGLLNEAWAPGGSVLIEAPVHLNFVRGFWQDDASLWRGPYDLGVRLFTGWDEEYFYTALLIHDQIRVPVDGTLDRLNGDLVYMAFDMAGDGGTTMGRDDFVQIFVSWKKGTRPGGDKPDRRFRRKDLRLGVTPDGTGVIWESALPWSFINDELTRAGMRAHHVKPRPGVSFGFNVVVVDDDGKGAKTTMSLAPGLRFGRDDRPARLETGGPFRVLDRRFCPGAFVRVELR